jgi:hypothetical protein
MFLVAVLAATIPNAFTGHSDAAVVGILVGVVGVLDPPMGRYRRLADPRPLLEGLGSNAPLTPR